MVVTDDGVVVAAWSFLCVFIGYENCHADKCDHASDHALELVVLNLE